MRLFAAVKIPDETRESLARFCEDLRKYFPLPQKVKWVETPNLHLTLKFFGEIEPGRLDGLGRALSLAAGKHRRFSARAKGAGTFPEGRPARVLWAGIEDPAGALSRLAESVESDTVAAGFSPSDKPFSPHLTLARFPIVPPSAFQTKLAGHPDPGFGEIKVDKVFLIESRLGPSGPVYLDLKEFHLAPRLYAD